MARYIDADKIVDIIKMDIKQCEIDVSESCDDEFYEMAVNSRSNAMYSILREIEGSPTVDVVPKSEEGTECPTCHGTGRIGTTDWLTKNISKKQLAEEKAKAIAEHEQYIKTELAGEIFAEIEQEIKLALESNYKVKCDAEDDNDGLAIYVEGKIHCLRGIDDFIAELKKKYIGE